MNDAFELLDPPSAQAFLKQFRPEVRRKGEALLRLGRVADLVPADPGVLYSARVQDGKTHEVDLHYDPVTCWKGFCDCPGEEACEHVYAAMSALWAEHRAATVRNLSAGVPRATWSLGQAKTQAPGSTGELARRLMAALGRPLDKNETRFVRKVQSVYANCTQTRHITNWDFNEMELALGGYGWDALQIWPAFPANEHDFWLYVAHTAQTHGVRIPAFMAPVTDLSIVAERIARWERSREIEKWKLTLANLQTSGSTQRPAGRGEVDLRVAISEKGALLQWQPPGEAGFKPIKSSQVSRLAQDCSENFITFTAEAEWVWDAFAHRLYGPNNELRYTDNEALRKLGRLLRRQGLESRIVRDDGAPLARPNQPLRWHLTPAANEHDDYLLRLVQADGTPPPDFLCILPGHPPLYLCADALFIGPAAQDLVLSPARENRIPAPALERAPGVLFLQSLGVELPPRVQERIRRLPLQVAIQCRLQPSPSANTAEDCAVSVVAEAPDGFQQVWTGYNWLNSSSRGSRKQAREGETITLYDRAVLESVPALLEPLRLRPATYGQGLVTRVNKSFPELFAGWLKTIPPQVTVQLLGDLASFASAEVSGRVKLDVTETEIDWFDLRVVLNVSDTTLTAEEIKLLLNAKGGFVRLEGKGWRRLRYELSEDEDERLARLGLSPRQLSAEPQRLHALQLADEAARKFLPPAQIEQIQRRVGELKARVTPALPAGVTAELRPYQLEGFHFLAYLSANRFGGILADDMGLGKTLQALAWLVWMREQAAATPASARPEPPPASTAPGSTRAANGEPPATEAGRTTVAPSLVVCPKSVMDNWHAEAARFTPGLRVRTWAASELPGFHEQFGSADLHVLNYSQLRLVGERLSRVRWQAVILDEGQYIKNPGSQTAQVARALHAEHRLVLSGTPIENRLLDLWSLMGFAMPGVLGHRAQFARLYDSRSDPFARRRLASRVRPFVLRRTKGQVAKDLPDRIEEDLFCEIEGEQQTLYRAELKKAQQLLLKLKTQKEVAQFQFNFLTSLLRLRQICCHPRLMKPDSVAPSAKQEALLEQLEPLMEEGEKVLVFSQFVEMLDLLRPSLQERKWPHFYLSGSTENRGDLVREFQSVEGPAVFLISLKAGGFGLNLTAANYVVLFDPWWNPAVENQAIDRTHRIGQVNKVIAYRLLIKNSIEEKIRELQKQKRALAEDVLGEEKFAQTLTLQDLRFLFAD